MSSFSSTLSLLFFKLYLSQKQLGLVFFQQILLLYVGMIFAFFPDISFKHQVTPRCSPTHVLKKTPFFFIAFHPPWPCQSKFPLENPLL